MGFGWTQSHTGGSKSYSLIASIGSSAGYTRLAFTGETIGLPPFTYADRRGIKRARTPRLNLTKTDMTSHLETTLAEFDKKWYVAPGTDSARDGESWYYQAMHRDDPAAEIKAFITSRYVDLEERIEGMRKHCTYHDGYSNECKQCQLILGSNQLLDDILSITRDNK